ncbi:putative cytochrome [Thioalkalivibrio nitratireducens DSM 14787]|uniref:Cytochrome n=1 Tax=Thioalkalivibrio nitratireducens (strain DSM 14787 / UNIQEM 213 / ALEN2) TaxID=1255043 RepID=L0DSA1_THIND|nr:cytochrome P460 family protein [Thioalkalivibrio nitratireducens]AGA31868.1 putative cytochrome [Thioalkalivibrio nitratireducens DSM 14787]
MTRTNRRLSTALALAAMLGAPLAAMADPVAYPEGYRHWHHAKSMVIHDGHPLADPFAGIHHIYVNDPALEGLQTGRYADGSVFVFDLLQAEHGDEVLTEGERKLVGVMVKGAETYQETGGWGFEGFAGDSRDQRLVSDGGQACFACHQSQADSDYVFTRWRP